MKLPALLSTLMLRRPDPTWTTPCVPLAQDLNAELAEVALKFQTARAAQSATSRRIIAFAKDHPELHRLYFTRAGDQIRKEQAHDAA